MPDTEKPNRKRDLDGRHLTYRVLAMPSDTNAAGDIFGGWLMSQVDIAGSILAVQAAAGRVATVAVNNFRFIEPVLIGEFVSCYSTIEKIGNTSITVGVEVEIERERDPNRIHRVAQASLTYVALSNSGRPRPVRQ